MEDDARPLDDLAEDVLEGRPVDWTSAESSPDPKRREAVQQLKVLAGIAGIHRSVAPGAGESPELEIWGRLKILERIGRGSFGDVYRAWDTKLDREVALKLLRTDMPQEGVLKEARLLARVRHPNVATVYDADEIDGRVGLWMEFIHGQNLAQILAGRKRLNDREVTRIGIELCRALSAVHDAGLLHRDIKAQNVMQAEDGRLVLMDFGTGSNLEKTPESAVDAAGTPLYLAPEIFEGADATVQSDIYSTGVLLFHLLTGSYPVSGSGIGEVGTAHASGQRLNLEARAPRVSKSLAAAITRAIESDPSKRFGSAKEMLSALETARRKAEGPRRAALIAAGFSLAVLLVGGVAWLSRSESHPPAAPLSFKARDWVLVSNFENRTGETLFDGSLDYALGLELANSRYVNVVSRERVGDALRLMRKPPDTVIDAPTAREICLRDGGIRALLTGRVDKIDSKYVASVELVDPGSGARLAGFREESDGADASLVAIRRISDRVRVTLGETPAPNETAGTGLAKVTTTSLKALQLYSRAENLIRDDLNDAYAGSVSRSGAAAEELLRRAIAEDSTFASAWIMLAFVLRYQEPPVHEFQRCAETALRLADTTTEREGYFIRGSYYGLLGDREKAIAAYETLLALYPDDYWAANNLSHLYDWQTSQREREKGVEVDIRLADSRPRDFFWNWAAVFDLVALTPDPTRAKTYARRATDLITPDVENRFPILVSYIDLVPFTENWVKGDLKTAADEIDHAADKIDHLGARARDSLAVHVALGYLTLGKIEAAARTAEKIMDPVVRDEMLAQIAFIKGDGASLRRYLKFQGDQRSQRVSEGWWDTTVVLRARAGLSPNPDVGSFEAVTSDGGSETLHVLRGEVALTQGRVEDTIRELQEASKFSGNGPYLPILYLGRESLAAVFARQGDVTRAIEVLEQKAEGRDAVTRGTTGAYWLRNRLQLAKLYRRAGRVVDAKAVEADLSKLLALADHDHPILLEIRRLPSS